MDIEELADLFTGQAGEVVQLDHVRLSLVLSREIIERSVELHEGFGFQREALFREHVRKAGAPADVVGLGMLASDWAALRLASRERLVSRGFDLPA